MTTASKLRIDVWSDYVCPFCYLQLPEMHRLEQEFGSAVKVQWRAFELRPEPHPTLDPAGEYLQTTWQRTVYPMARERGMELKLPPVQPRSRKAFEAAAYAQSQNLFAAMHEALFRAFFQQGRDIGDTEVLVDIGKQVGLEPDEMRQSLFDQRYTAGVVEDEQLARQLGISGVPMALLRPISADWDEADWQQAEALQGAVPYATLHAEAARLLAGH